MNEFLNAITEYIDIQITHINDIYEWKLPKSLPCDFVEQTTAADSSIALRSHIHHLFANGVDVSTLQAWYVKEWGGVRANSTEKLLSYINKSDRELIAIGYKGIATWSKILSTRKPEIYAIYDARVAFSLNAIQLLSLGNIGGYWKIPPSRNSSILNASPIILNHPTFISSHKQSYQDYIDLLADYKSTRGINNGVQLAEMVLFATAPSLASKLLNENLN